MKTDETTDSEFGPKLKEPIEVEAFAPGEYHGQTFGLGHMHEMVANFRKLRNYIKPAVRLGHSSEDTFGEAPAVGWISDLKVRKGEDGTPKLIASVVGVPPIVRTALAKGLWRRSSAELYAQFEKTEAERNLKTGVTGPVFSGLAWLGGGSVPRVKNLADICQLFAAAERATPSDDGRVWCDSPPATLEEKLRALRQEAASQRIETAALMERASKLSEPLAFTSFAPQEADKVGTHAHLALARLEAVIQRLDLNRDSLADRRKAARETILEWRRDDPQSLERLDPRDWERCIEKWSPSGGSAAHPELRASPRGVARPAAPLSKLSERHITGAPLYGVAGAEAERLGGADRYWRLRDIASAEGLDLTRHAERERGEALLFAELGASVSTASTYDEAHSAALRQRGVGPESAFAEAATHREVAELMQRIRPDLMSAYGRRPDASQVPAAFTEAVEKELCSMDVLNPDAAAATRRAAAKDPGIIPTYGRRAS